jgi:GNAT superfamily N-acetyltransferase
MTNPIALVIRDGLEADIAPCLALDHTYTTEYVWQVQFEHSDPQYHQAMFKTERLPRTLEATYPADERRLRLALATQHCFLAAVDRDADSVLGYLVMSSIPARKVALIQDLVVDRSVRRRNIGGKLLTIARRWAREQHLERLIAEVQTRNYPAIQFCQTGGLVFCGYNERYFDNQDIAVFFGQSLR